MKNVIGYFILIFVFQIIRCDAQANSKKGFTINGIINGLEDGIDIYLMDINGLDTISRSKIKGGHFLFQGNVPIETQYYYMIIDTLVTKIPSKVILLVNAPIQIKTSMDKWPVLDVKGSQPHDEYTKLRALHTQSEENLNKIANSLYAEIDKFSKIRTDAMKKGDSITRYIAEDSVREVRKRYDPVIEKEQKKIEAMLLTFIDNHPNSLYIPDLIMKCEGALKVEGMQAAYNKLTSRAKTSYFGMELKSRLDKMEVKEGGVVKDFIGQKPDGENMSLYEVLKRGKYTLLDFWASWCSPCREETPNVRKAYDLYHGKGFNVLSITCDLDKNAWKKAISKDTMSWFHIADSKMNSIYNMFGVKSIPATFILDENGVIIAMDLRGDALLKKLEYLFDKNN